MNETFTVSFDLGLADRRAWHAYHRELTRSRRLVGVATGGLLFTMPMVLGAERLWLQSGASAWWIASLPVLGATIWWAGQLAVDRVHDAWYNRRWPLGHCQMLLGPNGIQVSWTDGAKEVPWSRVVYVAEAPGHVCIHCGDSGLWLPRRGFESTAAYEAFWTAITDKWIPDSRASAQAG